MPKTLTLHDIPDQVHERLERSAIAHARSLGDEAIVLLDMGLPRRNATPTERLTRARNLRESFPRGAVTALEIEALKQRGRGNQTEP